MSALDETGRAALEGIIRRARSILEQDLAGLAEGRFGIRASGEIEDETELSLDDTALAVRREIVEVVEHLRSEGLDSRRAVARLIREAAFTHLNRLVAIRIAEAIGLLPPSLVQGRGSRGFQEVLEVAPLIAGDVSGGYWFYLRLCADELASDAPVLFDPRNPLLDLAPSPATVDELASLLTGDATAGLWDGDDTLGWAYQFFNSEDDRRAARYDKAGNPKAPGDSTELAVRNQFFTPRYVVDFLVQNSLGRRLLEAAPDSPVIEDLPLLVDPPKTPGAPLDLAEVRVLDPACGSGHFLLGAYDLLERAWEIRGVPPEDAADAILRALWGIDIDPRCCQIAAAALVLRARRRKRQGDLPRPNVICSRNLPLGATGMDEILARIGSRQAAILRRMSEELEQAPILGPLLRIEDKLAEEIRRGVFDTGKKIEGTLAATVPQATITAIRDDLFRVLHEIADTTTASPAQRLLAAEATDAVRFVEAMELRYDVVLMNPPFGEPVPATKTYLKAAYPWIPTKDYNLLAAFVGRGIALLKGDGYLGAITSRAGMFLKTFEAWRKDVFLGHRLVVLADLGRRVMEKALVEAAAYVIGAAGADADQRATFFRLLKDFDRQRALYEVIGHHQAGEADPRVFDVRLRDLDAVPGSPVAYWMSPSIRRLFEECPRIEGNAAEVRQGLATGDDFRFVRTFWEVDPRRIARSREETFHGRRWVPLAKGGEYSPFWADIHLVVDYADDGAQLKTFEGSVIRNPQYYFRPGLTWPAHTVSGFGPRILPAGCVFSHMGPSIFPLKTEPSRLLAWITSRTLRVCIDVFLAAGDEATSGGAKRKYEVGIVQSVPWPTVLEDGRVGEVGERLMVAAECVAERDTRDETTRRFIAPWTSRSGAALILDAQEIANEEKANLRILDEMRAVEQTLNDVVGVDAAGQTYLDEECGPLVTSYPADDDVDERAFVDKFTKPIDAMIDEIVAEKGAHRAITHKVYFSDRRLEVLSHAFERNPTVVAKTRKRLNLAPPEEPRESAERLFSYLVGLAFGRWDVRVGRDPTLAPSLPGLFDPVPLCPPGMLVDSPGVPSWDAPRGYAIKLPLGRVLVDEPGHPSDVELAIADAASALLDTPEQLIEQMLKILGAKTIRDHLRKHFFRDHLSRYSKSRRAAPIYWPLSVPSKKWGIWLYAPHLCRETLFATEREANRRLMAAENQVRLLEREREGGNSGRSPQQIARLLDQEESLAEELRAFRTEAERIANLGWEPDLDDGIVLCAAALANLFPQWPEAARCREELREGEYPWATVARFADRL